MVLNYTCKNRFKYQYPHNQEAKMKKLPILSLAFSLALLNLLAACGNAREKTPYELYQSAVGAAQSPSSVEARLDYAITVDDPEGATKINIASDVKQAMHPETGPEMEMHLTLTNGDGGEERENLSAYYRDGTLYRNYTDYGFKNAQPLEDISGQLGQLRLSFPQEAVLDTHSEDVPEGKLLRFTLSPEMVEEPMRKIISDMLILNLFAEVTYLDDIGMELHDITYELMLDRDGKLQSCTLDYHMELTSEGDKIWVGCRSTISDIRFDSLTAIEFPKDLDEYPEQDNMGMLDDEEPGDIYPIDLQGQYVPTPSSPSIVNNMGQDTDAALFLDSEQDFLDFYFWIIYQTQAGISAPEAPTGFADPSRISAEGLVRFFCFANENQLDAIADRAEQMYYLPDTLLPMTLDNFFKGYTYDPTTLPVEFGYTSTMLRLPFSLCIPAANPCRVERAEVLDASRVKITATGLNNDIEALPVNTQELVLFIGSEGRVMFESYSIHRYSWITLN